MKKSKAKSILACAVLASVMAVGNVAWATTYTKKVIAEGKDYSGGNKTECDFVYYPQAGSLFWGNGASVGNGTSDDVPLGATAWGMFTKATVYGSTAWGAGSEARGSFSTAWGGFRYYDSKLSTNVMFEGGKALGMSSTAFGVKTTAIGSGSTAWGGYTFVGSNSTYDYHAGGSAMGNASTAWGIGTWAMGTGDTAFGKSTIAGTVKVLTTADVSSGGDYYSQKYKTNDIVYDKTKNEWIKLTSTDTYSGNYNGYYKAGDIVVVGDSDHYATAFGENSKAGGRNSLAALGGTTGNWTQDTTTQVWSYGGTGDTNSGENAIAMGVGAVALAKNSVAIGQYAVTGLGENTAAKEKTIVTNEFAVGGGNDGTNVYYSRITGVADGVNANDAVNLKQMNEALATAGGGADVVGTANEIAVTDGTGDNDGKKVIGLDSAIKGKLTTYDTYVTSSGLNANSQKITKVADGAADTDAVNYGQVKGAFKSATFTNNTLTLTPIAGNATTITLIGPDASGNLKWGNNTAAGGTDVKNATAWGGSGSDKGGTASGNASTAFGIMTNASGLASTAFGSVTTASASYATAWGQSTTAGANYATAWGYSTTASAEYSTVWGYSTKAIGNCSTAWGYSTTANGKYSTAFGNASKAGGENSLAALGGKTGDWTDGGVYDSGGKNAVAIGEGAVAKANDSVAIGKYAQTDLGANASAASKTIVTNEFAVGGGNDGTNVYYSRITGVADGVNEHDAATYGQLKDAAYITGKHNYYGSATNSVTKANDAINELDTQVKTNTDVIATYKIKDLGTNEKNLVLADDGTLTLKTELTGLTSAVFSGKVTAGTYYIDADNSWTSTGITAKAGIFAGDVKAATFTVGSNTYISSNGLNANSQKITNVLAPTDDTDAANKKYVDDKISSGNALDVAYKTDSKTEIELAGEGGTTIHNVADGTVDTDAANVGQLKSAVGDAFTGATDSRGLKYDVDNSKLVANVPLNVTDATNNANLSATGLDVNGKVKVGTGLEDYTKDKPNTALTGISLVNDPEGNALYNAKLGYTDKGMSLKMQTIEADSSQNDMSLTSTRLEFSKKGSNVNARYSWDGVAFWNTSLNSNNGANVAFLSKDGFELYKDDGTNAGKFTRNGISAGGQKIEDVAAPESGTDAANKDYVDTAISSVNSDVSALTDRVTANESNIATLQSEMAQAQSDITQNTADIATNAAAIAENKAAIESNATDIQALQTKLGDGTSDGLVKDIATNAADIDKIEATIGDYSSVKGTQGITYAKTGTITGDVIKFDQTLVEHAGNIAELYSKIGVGTSGESNVYIGKDANATGVSVAIGDGAQATGDNTVSIGTGSKVTGANSIAVGNGHTVTGANSGTFGDPNTIAADNSYAIGNNNMIEKTSEEDAAGSFAVGNKNTIKNTAEGSFVMGNNVTVTSKNAVVLGNGSADGGENTVSVGAKDAERKIVNVANGNVAEGSTDAVNGGQLWEVEQKIDGNIKNELNTINNNIDRMGTRINKVGAGAAALAAMHPVYDEDSKLTFSAGLGSYRNEQAAAVGMFFRFSPRVMMNAGATVGNDNNMYNVGLNFALDRHVRGGLPSKAVMARQLNSLTLENSALKEKLATMDAKMVQQGEQIAQLMAMIEELKNK